MTVFKKLSAIESDINELKKLIQSQKAATTKQKEILTALETMELLRINRNTFNAWRSIGLLKVYVLNRRLYTKYSEIMESLENGLLEKA